MSEKADLPINTSPQKPRPAVSGKQKLILLAVFLVGLTGHQYVVSKNNQVARSSSATAPAFFTATSFPDASVTSSLPSVEWGPCPGREDEIRFSCGSYEVPLDHAEGFEGGVASIALSKYSADEGVKRLGSIFINPGGPGGSGFDYTFRAGSPLSVIVKGQYDIIGFDPRGIHLTNPAMRCFPSRTAETLAQSLEFGPGLQPERSREEYKHQVAKADGYNRVNAALCEGVAGTAGRHMGTGTVVRDIELLNRVIEGEDSLINFYGWSYGTVVGQYLMGIFPDKIGRVVIDGVCDPINWVENEHHMWGRSDYLDSEKTYEAFLGACADAGPQRCALASMNSTAKSLGKEVDAALDALLEHPLVIPGAGTFGIPAKLRPTAVKEWMFMQLYRPRGWGEFAQGLRSLIDGNGTQIYDATKLTIEKNLTVPASTTMSSSAVECSDSRAYPESLTNEEIVEMITEENLYQVKHVSRHFAGLSSTMCPRWGGMREPSRFTGPFNASLSNTMLVIGNTADPITSLTHAKLVNKIQPMTRLIHHDGFGHCSSAMPSLCTAKAIREYFAEKSKLPENGLVCKTDIELFSEDRETKVWAQAADGQLMSALHDLEGAVGEMGGRGRMF